MPLMQPSQLAALPSLPRASPPRHAKSWTCAGGCLSLVPQPRYQACIPWALVIYTVVSVSVPWSAKHPNFTGFTVHPPSALKYGIMPDDPIVPSSPIKPSVECDPSLTQKTLDLCRTPTIAQDSARAQATYHSQLPYQAKASRLLHWISGLGNHGAIWQRSCPAQSDGWRKLVDRGWAYMGSGA